MSSRAPKKCASKRTNTFSKRFGGPRADSRPLVCLHFAKPETQKKMEGPYVSHFHPHPKRSRVERRHGDQAPAVRRWGHRAASRGKGGDRRSGYGSPRGQLGKRTSEARRRMVGLSPTVSPQELRVGTPNPWGLMGESWEDFRLKKLALAAKKNTTGSSL